MKRRGKKKKTLRLESNLSELRRLKDLYGFEVWEFSDIHFRVVGKNVVDYWPSSGTIWLVGHPGKGRKATVGELCDLARGIISTPVELLHEQLDAEFREIMH